LNLQNRISSFLSRDILLRIFKQAVLPLVDYGCVIRGECSKENAQCLERLQYRAMRIILHANRNTCSQKMSVKLFLLLVIPAGRVPTSKTCDNPRGKRFCGVREQRITARKMERVNHHHLSFLALAPLSAQAKH